jgi:rhombotail lipoprotein
MRILLLASLAALGCSTGFNRRAMEEKLWGDEKIFTDDDVLRVERIRPQLQLPFRLAVAPPIRGGWRAPEELEGEREAILAWGEKLKASGVVSDFVLIPRFLIGGSRFKDARVAAARLGADAVLLLSEVSEVDAYVNPLAALNLTLVGMVVAPGHHRDALTIVEGVILDNRNEFVYFTASSEGKGHTVGPFASVNDRDAIRRSRVRAYEAFGDRLAQAAAGIKSPAPGPRYDTPGRK